MSGPVLSSFYDWSVANIRDVFEAKSAQDCLEALDFTFSKDLDFTFNGRPLPRAALQKIVLSMLEDSGFRLAVDWKNAVEVPHDECNRSGMLGGYYIIRNIKKKLAGSPTPVLCERHKSVNVVIESEDSDPSWDSRKIVKLAIVATDVPVPVKSPHPRRS